jgi:DNA-binding beta-propeller fold protein YncE
MVRFGLAIVLVGVLVLTGAAGASAAPFAYVYSGGFIAVVSVIDTATNTVAATVAVPPAHGINGPVGVAVAPDGVHVYVFLPCGLSVIDTATNAVVTTIGLPSILPPPVASCAASGGVAVAPDGMHVWEAGDYQINVIDTATNAVVKAIPLCCRLLGGSGSASLDFNPLGVAVTPEGARLRGRRA